jgi:voltage-gated potassium channel
MNHAALLAVAATAASTAGVPLTPGGIKQLIRTAVAKDPVDALAVTVLGGAWLFYQAERGHNDKVKTYWDALVFISTSLSVGYADIFARTPTGQAIASALMTFGPALSGLALEAPSTEESSEEAAAAAESKADREKALLVQERILEKLDAILSEMQKARPAS